MTTSDPKPLIYESPDGGSTVYSRPSEGNPMERTLVSSTDPNPLLTRYRKWWYILSDCQKNENLAKAVEQVEILWGLNNG